MHVEALRTLATVAFSCCMLRRNREHVQDLPVRRSYGFVSNGLEPGHGHWEICVGMLRRNRERVQDLSVKRSFGLVCNGLKPGHCH